jgi:ribosomal protein L40E
MIPPNLLGPILTVTLAVIFVVSVFCAGVGGELRHGNFAHPWVVLADRLLLRRRCRNGMCGAFAPKRARFCRRCGATLRRLSVGQTDP